GTGDLHRRGGRNPRRDRWTPDRGADEPHRCGTGSGRVVGSVRRVDRALCGCGGRHLSLAETRATRPGPRDRQPGRRRDCAPLTVALFLLGLGWNLCYVGGSSLLADQLSPAERARTQGFNDLLIGLASAAGSLGSGIVFATIGYNAMGLVGAATALIPLTTAA